MQSARTSGGPARALRVLFVANDGFSAGHVARTVAIARALGPCARAREIETRALIATTSSAHALLDAFPESFAVVRLPHPLAARHAGFADDERRRIVRGALAGTIEAFAPDLLVVDTFPTGPHGELASDVSQARRMKRVLVRRDVPEDRAGDPLLASGIERFDLTILAADPTPPPRLDGGRSVHVPPITIFETRELLSRQRARERLRVRLDAEAKLVLVAAGGGGDEEATRRAMAIATALCDADAKLHVALAGGPLAGAFAPAVSDRLHVLDACPLQPMLRAFDGAVAPAGYNTAHEIAKAGLSLVLFAQPRPFDDQAARARRFVDARLSIAVDPAATASDLSAALLARMGEDPPRTTVVPDGGAPAAADALLDLFAPRRTR